MISLNKSKNIRLSENFTLYEFMQSSKASRLNLHKYQEQITENDILNLRRLCENVLQPLRNCMIEPITITSGFRSPELNRAVSGSAKSDHLFGRAADFQCANIMLAFGWVKNNCEFKQLIYENWKGSIWIHVSYDEFANRNEVLWYEHGKYQKV